MKFPVAATAMTLCGALVLAGLGTWQIQRLHWKNDLTGTLTALYARDIPDTLDAGLLGRVDSGMDVFGYGRAQGHLLKDKTVLVGPRMLEGRSGYQLLIPLKMEGDNRPLIVNAGWVSDLWKDTLEDRLSTLPSDVTVTGLVRRPDWSRFTSRNSPANDLWFRPDPVEIAAAKDLTDVYTIILYADGTEPPLNDVLPQGEKWLPRNKHLQYALFWYAMGAALLAVYGFYIRSVNKKD